MVVSVKHFKTYTEAKAWAQAEADATGMHLGIEKHEVGFEPWSVFGMPQKKNRFGFERRAELVRPTSRWDDRY